MASKMDKKLSSLDQEGSLLYTGQVPSTINKVMANKINDLSLNLMTLGASL